MIMWHRHAQDIHFWAFVTTLIIDTIGKYIFMASQPQTRVGDEEDYHFFYNPFKKAIIVNEYVQTTEAKGDTMIDILQSRFS